MLGQVGPKLAPSWPQVAPKFAHVGPSWPKLAQVGPKLVPIWAQVVSCWLMLPLAPLPPERISQAMLSKMSTKALPLRRRCERSSNKQMLFNVANVQITSRCLSICLANVQVTRMFYPAGASKTKEFLWMFLSQAMISKMSTKALPLRRRCERSSNKQMPFNMFDERSSSKDVPSSWRFQNEGVSLEFLNVFSWCFLLVVLSC